MAGSCSTSRNCRPRSGTASTLSPSSFADGAYGNVRRMQKEDYGNRLVGVDLQNPQFPKMAESFGAAGVRTTTPDGLRRELAAALKRRGTTLIEVAVGEMPDPWKVLIPPRIRGNR